MAARFDFDLIPGDSYPAGDGGYFVVTLSTGPDLDHLTPSDLTGAVIGVELRAVRSGPLLPVTFDTQVLNQTTNLGEFTWRLPASETDSLDTNRHFWRLYIQWAGSDSRTTLIEGRVDVRNPD